MQAAAVLKSNFSRGAFLNFLLLVPGSLGSLKQIFAFVVFDVNPWIVIIKINIILW